MKKLTVLIDMDDTIEMLGAAWCKYLNARHGTTVAHEDLNQWDVAKKFPSLTTEEVYAPLFEDDFWDWVKPINGAAEGIKKIIDDGHTVYIVTTSDYKTIRAKMEKVLFRYFSFLTWSDVIVTANKQIVQGDILIDDGLHNLVGGKYEKILMTAPHNKGFNQEEKYGIHRVNNWEEAYNLVWQFAEGGR